ncbi:MAG: hypothetical protein CMJ18_24360 [Phycisphaeraceae bacterium]|nr:hypothetical protein [Phycisphaeraceae bacterium]
MLAEVSFYSSDVTKVEISDTCYYLEFLERRNDLRTFKVNAVLLCAALALGVATLPAGAATMAAHWDFNEGSGFTANDVSGNGHNMEVPEANRPNIVWGDDGGSFPRFNGTGDYSFKLPGDPNWYGQAAPCCGFPPANTLDTQLEPAGSVAAWFRKGPNPLRGPIFSVPRGGAGHSLGIGGDVNSSNQLAGSLGNATSGDFVLDIGATPFPTDSDWHHVVLTWVGGSHADLYLDGVATGAQTALTFTPELSFFPSNLGSGATNWFYFEGDIDEVSLWSGELSGGEVAALHAAGKPIPEPATLGLLGLGALLMLRRRKA